MREVAADLRINFNTVARAYRILHEEGVISTQQGRGTFVLAQAPPGDSARLRAPAELRAAHLTERVGGWLAEIERMGYRPDEVERAWNDAFSAWSEAQGPKQLE